MSVGERISLIIKELYIPKKTFANSLNISSSQLSDWINPNRRSNPTILSLTKIYEKYNVDLIWLLTGEGSMFISEREIVSNESCQILHVESDIAAGDPVESTGHRLETFQIGNSFIQNVNDYFCFRVNGRSMEPDIKHQDLVLIKKDINWKDKNNTICAVMVDGEITLKKVVQGHKHKTLVLFSINTDYPTIVVDPKHSDVRMIGKLYLTVRKED